MMAAVAKYRNDQAGTLTTGGSSTAYTLTSNQVFASLSAMNGMSLRVKFNATNGASPTLNVDGLGAKAIVTVTGTAVPTASIVANTVHNLVFSNSSSEWILVGQPLGALIAPQGTSMIFSMTTPPPGWTKDTNPLINDRALRLVTGSVSTGGTAAFTTAFSARTIAEANLPSHTHTYSGFTSAEGDHAHSVTHAVLNTSGAALGSGGFQINNVSENTGATGTHAHTYSGTTSATGSGTSMDFAVAYVDVIIANKD